MFGSPPRSMPVSSSIWIHAPSCSATAPGTSPGSTFAGRSTLPCGLVISTMSPFLMPRSSASTLLMKHSCGYASRSDTTLSLTVWARRSVWGVHRSSGYSSVCVPWPCSGSPICHLPMGDICE